MEFAFESIGIGGFGARWRGVFIPGSHQTLYGDGLEVREQVYEWQQGTQALGWVEQIKRTDRFAEVAIVLVWGDGEVGFVIKVHTVVVGDHQSLYSLERTEMGHDDLELPRRSMRDLELSGKRR